MVVVTVVSVSDLSIIHGPYADPYCLGLHEHSRVQEERPLRWRGYHRYQVDSSIHLVPRISVLARYVVVSGGSVSGLGKGTAISSLGVVLKSYG